MGKMRAWEGVKMNEPAFQLLRHVAARRARRAEQGIQMGGISRSRPEIAEWNLFSDAAPRPKTPRDSGRETFAHDTHTTLIQLHSRQLSQDRM